MQRITSEEVRSIVRRHRARVLARRIWDGVGGWWTVAAIVLSAFAIVLGWGLV